MTFVGYNCLVQRKLQTVVFFLCILLIQELKTEEKFLECYKCRGGENGVCAKGPFKDVKTTKCASSNDGSAACTKQKIGHMIVKDCKSNADEAETGCFNHPQEYLACGCREHLCNGVNPTLHKEKVFWNTIVTIIVAITVMNLI